MNKLSDGQIIELLRAAMSTPAAEAPPRELWPRVRRMIDRTSQRPTARDYVLVTAAALVCLGQPSLIELLLFLF